MNSPGDTPDTVVLANGAFPAPGTRARRILENASRVVCCDGAADAYFAAFAREPDAVAGDCDSVRGRFRNVVRIAGQDTNDLAKAVRHCESMGWKIAAVLGATGKREDHAIANVFLALDLGLEVVTDLGRFVPVCGRASIETGAGAPVSVFAPDPSTRVVSRGLEWPLENHVFSNLYSAALNRAVSDVVEIASTRPVAVFAGFVDFKPVS